MSEDAAPFATRTVDSGGVRIATRDYGGQGLPPLLLMHGAGMDQGSLEPLCRELRSSFRVVTFDFRGHGSTEVAPWSLAAAVHDARAVADDYGLGVPVVGGHSLGGMVAAAFAEQHPSCPAAINIDGHGHGRPEQFEGYDEADVRALLHKQQRKVAWLTRGPVALALRGLLTVLGKRPASTPATMREVLGSVETLDLLALYRRVTCPLLVFNAVAADERLVVKLLAGDRGRALARAHRSGIRRDLAELAADHSNVEVAEVEATHMLVRTHPALVAEHVTRFLQGRSAARL